jgi:hypothetical protein
MSTAWSRDVDDILGTHTLRRGAVAAVGPGAARCAALFPRFGVVAPISPRALAGRTLFYSNLADQHDRLAGIGRLTEFTGSNAIGVSRFV